MAILAGDALLAMAFELIADSRDTLQPDRVLEALAIVARASGTQGMVGGQVADIENEGRDNLDEATVASIHARKTGALLTASLLGGACLSGATPEQMHALRQYGNEVGLAFQIIDDILDIEGDAGKLGKPIGSDLKQDKATYPKVLGIERSRSFARDAAHRAIEHLSEFDANAEPLRSLAHYFVERDS
jgi:geranylgeranyl diphosphate synthase type II